MTQIHKQVFSLLIFLEFYLEYNSNSQKDASYLFIYPFREKKNIRLRKIVIFNINLPIFKKILFNTQ